MDHLDKARVLVVDDEQNNRTVLVRGLELLGYATASAGNGIEAIACLQADPPDVMVLDLKMPQMGGEKVLEWIRAQDLDLAVIVLTAHATLESAIGAVKAGAVDYLLKPQKISEINQAIQRSLKHRESTRQKEQAVAAMEKALALLKNDPADAEPLSTATAPQPCWSLNPENRSLTIYKNASRQEILKMVELTEVQMSILIFLEHKPGKVVSNKEIAQEALGYAELSELEAERIVRPHILRLRRKIEPEPENPRYICAIRGRGYTLERCQRI
jgi:DNA-binding response OmpR family regulator